MEKGVSRSKGSGRITMYPENSVLVAISPRFFGAPESRSDQIRSLKKISLAAVRQPVAAFLMMASGTEGTTLFSLG
jgi:hypothetical protein